MGPEQFKFVANSQIITSSTPVGASPAAPFQLTNPFPIGDAVYNDLNLRFTTGLNLAAGGGQVVTDGGLGFIQAITFQTPQHLNVVDGVDGILMFDMMRCRNRGPLTHIDAPSTAPGQTGAGEYYLPIPFKDYTGFNQSDLGLDVLRSGNPLLQLNTLAYNSFVSGGASGDQVNKFTLETILRLDPGPVRDPDLPTQWMPYFGVLKFAVSATVVQQQIFLAFNDRVYKRIFITQRSANVPYPRLANTVVGVNETDRMSLKLNSNFSWVDRVEWGALQAMNAADYRLAQMPTGMAVIDFFRPTWGNSDPNNPNGGASGAKLTDALSVLSKNQGTIELDIDITTGNNNPQLWIGYDAVKVLPLGARRPAPAPAIPAKG